MIDRAKPYHLTAGLALLCALAAFSTSQFREDQSPSFAFNVVSIISSKAPEFTTSERLHQFPILFVHYGEDAPPFLHPAFLLFDFKQNLRHWPVLAGDISRSPPFPVSVL
jgi:hypothetical protein